MTTRMMYAGLFAALLGAVLASPTFAGGKEYANGCRGNNDDPCIRMGFCSIQNTDWDQTVTADRSEKFDSQGWPGLCDMVHVALVQGNCDPLGTQSNVTAYLGDLSSAVIPELIGSLACGGELPDDGEGEGDREICGNGFDDDGDGKIDEKPECRRR